MWIVRCLALLVVLHLSGGFTSVYTYVIVTARPSFLLYSLWTLGLENVEMINQPGYLARFRTSKGRTFAQYSSHHGWWCIDDPSPHSRRVQLFVRLVSVTPAVGNVIGFGVRCGDSEHFEWSHLIAFLLVVHNGLRRVEPHTNRE